jgi:hypothetical protein
VFEFNAEPIGVYAGPLEREAVERALIDWTTLDSSGHAGFNLAIRAE